MAQVKVKAPNKLKVRVKVGQEFKVFGHNEVMDREDWMEVYGSIFEDVAEESKPELLEEKPAVEAPVVTEEKTKVEEEIEAEETAKEEAVEAVKEEPVVEEKVEEKPAPKPKRSRKSKKK